MLKLSDLVRIFQHRESWELRDRVVWRARAVKFCSPVIGVALGPIDIGSTVLVRCVTTQQGIVFSPTLLEAVSHDGCGQVFFGVRASVC